jgi:hypothetical protein
MSRARSARFSILVSLAALILTGCAHEPAFRAELARAFEAEGKAIAIIGDLQQTSGLVRLVRRREDNRVEQRRLIDDLAARTDELAALVILGDLVYTARSARHWENFDGLVEPFVGSMPILPAIGNHDYPCYFIQLCRKSKISRGMLERFPWFEPGRPYAVESGDLLLLFLDSESALESQGIWLEDRLESAAAEYSAALVFFHRPAFTNSIDYGAKPDLDIQQHIVPRLEAAALPVVAFSGHVHGFEYIVRNGVRYVTSAGGGGPRGPLADERPFDSYRGPDCPQGNGVVLRPFNYLLLREQPDRLTIEVQGFCRGDDAIRTLDTIEVPVSPSKSGRSAR